MRIGVDIDGVLFPWTDVANEVAVARFGIPSPGPHRYWDFLKEQMTPEQWRWLWSAEGQDAVFGQVERCYPDAVLAVNTLLRRGHQVHFVTHRDPRKTAGHTAAFLGRHFGGYPWAGVHVVQTATKKHTLGHWDAFVDDKPSTVWDMLDHTKARVFAPARLWNDELAGVPRLVRYADAWQIVQELA